MSCNNNIFWTSKDSGCLTDGKVCLGSSSKEEKRHHHWDAAEETFLSSKKQATESIDNRPIPRTANMNTSLWGNSPSSGSGQFNDPGFVPDPIRTIDLSGKDVSSSGIGHLNIQSRGLRGQFENDSAVKLSMSHTLKEPLNLNGEIGKGSVTGGRNSMNAFSMSIEHQHDISGNSKILSCSTNQTNTTSAFQLAYDEEDHNSISLGPSFNKAHDNFILMGQALGKGGGEFMLKGNQHHRVNENMLSMLQPFDKGSCSFVPLDQRNGDSNNNFFPDGPAYSKEHENFVIMGPSYGKLSENFKPMAPTFDKIDGLITPINQTHYKEDASTISMGITFDPGNSNILSMGQNYDVGESTIISFGTDANSSSSGVISGSDLLISSQSSIQVTEATPQEELIERNSNQITKVTSTVKNFDVSKGKEQKKGTANNFPANVKSMLSTGIFDGVPVKYVSWSREKSLRGVIRGSGYLCGCDDCKFSKVLNAYEFERHTGCKTKHPNNHIYFENGKTVYSVVQELKSTTQEVLFEAIQSVTGSPINLKNFHAWRVSYQAATRELERIYGKDDTVVHS